MTRIRFEDSPSTNTPINASNLDKLNNVVISSSEPTTGEEVWIKKGNNLIDLSLFETKTVNDVTFTNNGNGTITINGTANGTFGISLTKLSLKTGNYSFSSNSNENTYIYDYDSFTAILSNNSNVTFNQDYNNVGLDMYIEQGTVFNNVLISPMLNMGSQLPFEKYTDKKIYVQNDNGVYEEFSKGEEDSGWIPLTLTNDCTTLDWHPLKARKKNGIVTIMGTVNIPSTSWNKQIAIIPEGFRPYNEIDTICRSAYGADMAYIIAFNSDGSLCYLENININVTVTEVTVLIFATYIAD